MSASSKAPESYDDEEKTLMKVRPTLFNAKLPFFLMFLAYVLVAVFFLVRPMENYANLSDDYALGLSADETAAFFLFVVVAPYCFYRAQKKRAGTVYEITTKKVVRKDGLLSSDYFTGSMSPEVNQDDPYLNKMGKIAHWRFHTQEIPYSMVERVDLHQNIPERIMNIGNLKIDTGEDEIWMMRVPHVNEVHRLIMNNVGRVSHAYQDVPQPRVSATQNRPERESSGRPKP